MKNFAVKLFLLSFLFVACKRQDEYRDIRDYYFPLKPLQEGMVYEFRAVDQEEMSPAFWYFRSVLQDDRKLLTSTYYETDLLPLQHVQEEMVSNGMLLSEMYLYSRDSLPGGRQRRAKAEIIAGNVFPFSVRDSGGVFLYHVRWQDPGDSLVAHAVIKNRYFAGDTTVVFEGKTLPAIKFALRENYEMDSFGVLETTYTGMEVYAKGIGLFYYRKDVGPDFRLEYRLARRYPMEELEQQFRQRYPE